MKRGIFRMIAGAVMILLQLLAIIGQFSVENTVDPNVGFYSVGIVGIVLLIFGARAYRNEVYSQLVLHANSKKIHTVTKWVAFVLTTLLFVFYLLSYISSWADFNIANILMIFGTLSFAVYLLFYVYKKPSCLFSAALIFTGVAYLYGLISNITYYVLYLPDMDNYILYVVLGIIPKLITGILYIIIAAKVYNENFSVKAIKILGWIAFALEFINRILCYIVVFQRFYFYDIGGLLLILFAVALLLYTSVFKINSLREATVEEIGDAIRFCRKCGSQLISDSEFCSQCGTRIVKE